MKKFIFSLCFLWACSVQAARQPNIVFFFADDQTSSSLACYGHPLVKTPNIDRLATEGIKLTNFYVNWVVFGVKMAILSSF